MSQKWLDITFVHWAVDPGRVAPMLPAGARPDTLDGASYVGLIPFRMVDAGFGRGPAVPYFGNFLETNVRYYSVDDEGRHGVVFGSLEASRLLVSLGARVAAGTPYTWAAMHFQRVGAEITYSTRRRWPSPRGAKSRMRVELGEPIEEPSPLDHFLTARFGLHTRIAGRTAWIPNAHPPWPLQRARLCDLDDELLAAAGFPDLASTEPASVLHSVGTRTEFGLPRWVGSGASAGSR